MDDADLYLRAPNEASGETLIAGPLLGALRTVLEVERLADAVENLPDDRPVLALLDGTLAFWDLQRGNYPRYVADVLIAERLQPALARLRAASTDRRPVAVAAYTSRPRTTEGAGAVRLMVCGQGDDDCNRLCSARHSDLTSCDSAAGFDDRELFELAAGTGTPVAPVPVQPSGRPLRPGIGHRPGVEPLLLPQRRRRDRPRRGPRLAGRAILELLALSHVMLVKQCELGLGYPVAISEAHEQAVITGHDREESRRLTLMLLEQRGLPTPESAKATSKRRPWV